MLNQKKIKNSKTKRETLNYAHTLNWIKILGDDVMQ